MITGLNFLPVNAQSNKVSRSSEEIGCDLWLLDSLDLPVVDGGDDVTDLERSPGRAVSGDIFHPQQQLLILWRYLGLRGLIL